MFPGWRRLVTSLRPPALTATPQTTRSQCARSRYHLVPRSPSSITRTREATRRRRPLRRADRGRLGASVRGVIKSTLYLKLTWAHVSEPSTRCSLNKVTPGMVSTGKQFSSGKNRDASTGAETEVEVCTLMLFLVAPANSILIGLISDHRWS